MDYNTLHNRISNAKQREIRDMGREYLKPSPYPVFDKPLEMIGDAVIIPDPEFPYHHAEFLNRVLDLAEAWKINQCIIAGDAMHFNSISKWEASWTVPTSGLSERDKDKYVKLVLSLPNKYRESMLEWLDEKEMSKSGDSVGDEVAIAKRELVRLGEQFDLVHYVIGNHDGRFLSALNSPLFADQLLQFIGINDPKWKIAPYYYSVLHSGETMWRIEHPRGAAKNTASALASKFLCNIAMGHSHRWVMEFDRSGHYYAIHMGCCVDETRLAYAAQRSIAGEAHKLGALIIREGKPFLLNEDTPWEMYKKM